LGWQTGQVSCYDGAGEEAKVFETVGLGTFAALD
jgi:hypothetical protein